MARRDLIFRVFVSSTFSDLKAERNALQQNVFPVLRKYCQERGARFQAIDLRWGVSAEAALDQQTMRICFEELARCQEVSPRPNFIILLGERYGWIPLPARIPVEEFREVLSHVPAGNVLIEGSQDVPSWVDGQAISRTGWYRKDENAVPVEYVLQPRTISFPAGVSKEDKIRIGTAEAEDWRRIEAEIRTLFIHAIAKLGWRPGDPRRAKYEHSATHQEIAHGALETQDADRHVFGYFRAITGAPQDESVGAFMETGENKSDLDALKSELRNRLPKDHVLDYGAEWARVAARNSPNGAPVNPDAEADLSQLCSRVLEDLTRVINDELRAFQKRDERERENEAQSEFGLERSRHFIGRGDILARIEAYLIDEMDRRPFVVHGVSGCGKTALMARAWRAVAGRGGTGTRVVARFIGATPASADLRTLLHSLCQELGSETPPTDINDLVREFCERLSEPEPGKESVAQPARAVLFLDALDQLNSTDNARLLHWLPRELAAGVKVVVSVLDGSPAQSGQASAVDGDCFSVARHIRPTPLAEVGPLCVADGRALLEAWLHEAGRTLQDSQMEDVLAKFERDGRPLYLKVAFEEARLWKSWQGLPYGAGAAPGLSRGVEGVLGDMLDRLEQPRHHGRMLVERALGNIAAARNGLTEDELLDILSRDRDVMADYFARNPESPRSEEEHLPIVVWSRLHADLKPYMARRRADGAEVMNFYHRQVGDVVANRYFGRDAVARLAAHGRLAEYFHTLDYWAESLEAQRVRAKRLPPTPRPANVRKVVELPYHRLEAAKLGGNDDPASPYWDAVADLLTDWRFLEAKAEADPNHREGGRQGVSAAGEESP